MSIEDTVNVPISLMIFLGGLIVSMLCAMFSFSGHLLISIRNSMALLVTKMAVRDTEVEGRLKTLERHDSRNEDERAALGRWERQQERGSV